MYHNTVFPFQLFWAQTQSRHSACFCRNTWSSVTFPRVWCARMSHIRIDPSEWPTIEILPLNSGKNCRILLTVLFSSSIRTSTIACRNSGVKYHSRSTIRLVIFLNTLGIDGCVIVSIPWSVLRFNFFLHWIGSTITLPWDRKRRTTKITTTSQISSHWHWKSYTRLESLLLCTLFAYSPSLQAEGSLLVFFDENFEPISLFVLLLLLSISFNAAWTPFRRFLVSCLDNRGKKKLSSTEIAASFYIALIVHLYYFAECKRCLAYAMDDQDKMFETLSIPQWLRLATHHSCATPVSGEMWPSSVNS